MKNYSTTTDSYLRSAGLKKVYLRNEVGELRATLKTDKAITALRRRGVQIHDSK